MKGYITKEQLSDSLKEYLQTLGLTEEQVNEAINLSVGDKEQLQTNDKSSIVNAINENKTSILEIQTELGANKTTLQSNINEIREVL